MVVEGSLPCQSYHDFTTSMDSESANLEAQVLVAEGDGVPGMSLED